MLQKFTSQQVQPQPPAPSPLSSQPLPNPKGGINAVHSKEVEGEEDEDENEEGSVSWWYVLLAQLVDSDDEEDGESEDESDEEDEEESVEEDSEDESDEEENETEEEEKEESEDKKGEEDEEEIYNNERTFFIATLFNGKGIKEEEIFTTADASVVPVVGIAENVLVRIGELSIPVDFHVIKCAKGEKGGTPQVLLERPFLKTAEFKLIYYDEIFTFSVGNAIEIFHLTQPPKPRKKGLHQLQENKGKKAPREEEKVAAKVNENPKEIARVRRRSSENSQITGEKKKRKKKKKRIPNPEKGKNHNKNLEDGKKKKNQKK
ncbi:hypothetical protein PIB30_091257 [Stylosanthes scabra]|uniref:Nucleoplasmin-like domain-containing protein n=1 Tax=Stylosanthes scabra TaxID=79078 RepID=A0ABU6ZT78_9FABA|nr:hypothetical protein [Stylosanthes scabra]